MITIAGIKLTQYQEYVMTKIASIRNKYLANFLMAALVPILTYKIVMALRARKVIKPMATKRS